MNNFIDSIKKCGVVGAGGAGFPTHVKLAAHSEYIIVNTAECEPLIRVDQQLITYYTKEFLNGLNMIIKHTNSKKGYIAIKGKHNRIIEKLENEIEGFNNIEIFKLQDFYPAGDEHMTVHEVLGRVVPQGGIPINVGCVVINVETVLNVYNAVKDIPTTQTFVTLTGEVKNPATYKLPIGITYREALNICGTYDLDKKVLIDGGPMMGNVVYNFDEVITKTTKAIIVLDKKHSLIRRKTMTLEQRLLQSKAACLQCSRCTDLCPRYLLGHDVRPHMVMRVSNYGLKDFDGLKTALGCSECGICELYSCPSDLSPKKINIEIKHAFAKAGIKIDYSKNSYVASQIIDYRKIPVNRLIERLNIEKYDVAAPLFEIDYKPKKVAIKLKQHLGAPAAALVKVGQTVEEGELIAEMGENKMGANIHSSLAGLVIIVNDDAITIEKK